MATIDATGNTHGADLQQLRQRLRDEVNEGEPDVQIEANRDQEIEHAAAARVNSETSNQPIVEKEIGGSVNVRV